MAEHRSNFFRLSILIVLHLFLMANLAVAQDLPQHTQTKDPQKDNRFNAVAWMQKAAEYRLATTQAYRIAALQLDAGLADTKWSADEVQLAAGDFEKKTPAIILDVDETVLDNSPFNARGILDGKQYSTKSWNDWCLEEKATPIPGSLEFIKSASKKGVQIFYVTNRRDEVKQATINNLNQLGYKADSKNVLTKNNKQGRESDKVSRRAMVAKNHRIILLVGDNMNDFCSGMDVPDSEKRNATAKSKTAQLGGRWILLPNPVYGGWERALGDPTKALRTQR